jgi:hypothetical protein
MNLQQLIEQILLGRKMIVDRPGLHPGGRRNRPHRHRRVPRLGKQLQRHIAQLFRRFSSR